MSFVSMKPLISIFFLILLSISSFAQNHILGVKNGINWNLVKSERDREGTVFQGFATGLTYDIIRKNKISYGVELLLERDGYSYYLDGISNPFLGLALIEIRTDYLSLPLKFGYYYGNKFEGFINFGVVPSLLINETFKIPKFKENGQSDGFDVGKTQSYESEIDVAILGEAGIGYRISENFSLRSTFRFQHRINKYFESYSNTQANRYRETLSFGIHYKIK